MNVVNILCCLFPLVFMQDNLALNKTAKQSSTYNGNNDKFKASHAVDGHLGQDASEGHCTHTKNVEDLKNWWEVDLDSLYLIGSVKLWNRVGEWGKRLSNFTVLVGTPDQDSVNYKTCTFHPEWVDDVQLIPCDTPVSGQIVRIEKPAGSSYLTLCEVEVYGHEEDTTPSFIMTSEDTASSVIVTSEDTTLFFTVTPEDTTPNVIATTEETTPNAIVSSEDTTPNAIATSEETTPSVNGTSEDKTSSVSVTPEDTTSSVSVTSEDTTSSVGVTSEDTTTSVIVTSEDATSSVGVTSEDTTTSVSVTSEDTESSPGVTDEDAISSISVMSEYVTSVVQSSMTDVITSVHDVTAEDKKRSVNMSITALSSMDVTTDVTSDEMSEATNLIAYVTIKADISTMNVEHIDSTTHRHVLLSAVILPTDHEPTQTEIYLETSEYSIGDIVSTPRDSAIQPAATYIIPDVSVNEDNETTGITERITTTRCTCLCLNTLSTEEKIAQIKNQLQVATSNLSSTTRRKISAVNQEASAKYIGASGIVMVTLICALVLVPDVLSTFAHLMRHSKDRGKRH